MLPGFEELVMGFEPIRNGGSLLCHKSDHNKHRSACMF